MLERGYARQMLAYPASPATSVTSAAWTKATTPVPDVATVVPSTTNGGITNGGKTYTFHIKKGVNWDCTPVRQVTSRTSSGSSRRSATRRPAASSATSGTTRTRSRG